MPSLQDSEIGVACPGVSTPGKAHIKGVLTGRHKNDNKTTGKNCGFMKIKNQTEKNMSNPAENQNANHSLNIGVATGG